MRERPPGICEAEKKTVLFAMHDIDEAVFMGTSVSRAKLQPLKL
jgi:ABC-type nitrate/sulfonate/bicarbonate transport system ATPase subunit